MQKRRAAFRGLWIPADAGMTKDKCDLHLCDCPNMQAKMIEVSKKNGARWYESPVDLLPWREESTIAPSWYFLKDQR
jgi:hypothetical protein